MKLSLALAIALTATVLHGQVPVVSAVTNAGYFSVYGFAPGSLVTIYGRELSNAVAAAESFPLPKSLAGSEVHFCRRDVSDARIYWGCAQMELLYVSPTQINFVLSYEYIDLARVGVAVKRNGSWNFNTQGQPSSFAGINLNWVGPGIFAAGYECPISVSRCALTSTRVNSDQVLRATVTDAQYRLVTTENPAVTGGTYVAWLTGLGNVGRVDDLRGRLEGLRLVIAPWPIETDLRIVADAEMLYAGVVAGFSGLYQLNFKLPPGVRQAITNCAGQELWLTLWGRTTSRSFPVPVTC